MHSFERLIREHKAICALAHRLVKIADGPRDAPAGHAALEALATTLGRHLAAEDGEIYPRLMVSQDEGAASAAREAVAAFETLAADFTAYVAAWTRDAIATDWASFGAETRTLIARLDARIRVENELLYPLALRAANITLREVRG